MGCPSVSLPLLIGHVHHVLHHVVILFLVEGTHIVIIRLGGCTFGLRYSFLPRYLLAELTVFLIQKYDIVKPYLTSSLVSLLVKS